eukprot:scaffold2203_cov24-Phaeocystis_antarctica.AAC.1
MARAVVAVLGELAQPQGHCRAPQRATDLPGGFIPARWFAHLGLQCFRHARAATNILPAGRAGRRLNAKDSLMVHWWDRPTTSATSRHHRLQLPLLLEMVENKSHNQQS